MTQWKTPARMLVAFVAWAAGGLGCGDEGRERDWEEEVILQLFKPAASELGVLTVKAGQNATTREVKVNEDGQFFSSCEVNRIRVIPGKVAGLYPELTLTITASKLSTLSFTKKLSIPVSAADRVEKLVLVKSGTLVPVACAPKVDFKATGEACSADYDCIGNKCLKTVDELNITHSFKGGYCSRDCKAVPTSCIPGAETCKTFDTAAGGKGEAWCLKNCKTSSDCRANEAYDCSAAGLCTTTDSH